MIFWYFKCTANRAKEESFNLQTWEGESLLTKQKVQKNNHELGTKISHIIV